MALPSAHAQLLIGEEAEHERLEITINDDATAHVLHEIRQSASPVTMLSVDGEYENLVMTDPDGNVVQHAVSQNRDNFGVTIFGSSTNTIIEYDLVDAISKVGAYYTWDFRYLEATLFIIPESITRVYINDAPVDFEEARKLKCHGCEALIEYAPEEPARRYVMEAGGAPHAIGIRTVAGVSNIEFGAEERMIRAELSVEEHAHLGITIPNELLEPPYEIHHESGRLIARVESQNATHTELQTRVPGSGVVGIFGNMTGVDANFAPLDTTETPTDQLVSASLIVGGAAGIAVSLAIWWRRRAGS